MNLRYCLIPLCIFIISCSQTGVQSRTSSPTPKAPSRTESGVRADVYYDYLSAQFYLAEKQIDKAVEAYTSALKKDPTSPILLTELATLNIRQGNIDTALRLAEEATTYDPGYEPAHMLLGQLYAGLGRNSRAIDAYRKVIEINPENEDAFLLLGALLPRRDVSRKPWMPSTGSGTCFRTTRWRSTTRPVSSWT